MKTWSTEKASASARVQLTGERHETTRVSIKSTNTCSASRTDSTVNSVLTNKKSKPLHPSGLLTSYKSQPSSKTASTTTTPNSTTEAPDDSIKYGGYIASDSESEVEFAEASETGDRKTSQVSVETMVFHHDLMSSMCLPDNGQD